MEKVRFDVWVGGGIGELYELKTGLTFKQAVKAWVAGQKRCPTDCSIDLAWDDNLTMYEQEKRTKEVIRNLVTKNLGWCLNEWRKQEVYNDEGFTKFDNPFTRG